MESEKYSLEQLKGLQLKKLKALIRHACDNVPLVRDAMKSSGVSIEDLHTLDDLAKFPFCSKQTLRNLHARYVTDNSRKLSDLYRDSTSGSTGEPFVFFKDEVKRDKVEAFKMRNFRWIGGSYGRKYYSLWGFTPHLTLRKRVFQKIVSGRRPLAADAPVSEMKRHLKMLQGESNVYLEGYTSAVVLLAKLALETGVQPRFAGVVPSAETLSLPHRRLIKDAFNCEVFNRYGSREFGDIAIETSCHEGLHVYDESFIVEIVRKDGTACRKGEVGEIVVTDLDNYAMPFIRYRTGDLAAFPENHPSNCALSHSVISYPLGRMVDYIQVGDKIISFGFMVLTFEDYPQIRQFQLEQVSDTHLVLRVVIGPGYTEELMAELLQKVQDYCKPLDVVLKHVDKIRPEKSGKIRIVKSLRSLVDIQRAGFHN